LFFVCLFVFLSVCQLVSRTSSSTPSW